MKVLVIIMRLHMTSFFLLCLVRLSSEVFDSNGEGTKTAKTGESFQKLGIDGNTSPDSKPLLSLSPNKGSDRTRTGPVNCPSGQYLQRNQCKACVKCEKKQYEISACSAMRNTICISHKEFKMSLKCLQLHRIRRIGHLLKRKGLQLSKLQDPDQIHLCSSRNSRMVMQAISPDDPGSLIYTKLGMQRKLIRSLKTPKRKERTRTVKRESTLAELITSTPPALMTTTDNLLLDRSFHKFSSPTSDGDLMMKVPIKRPKLDGIHSDSNDRHFSTSGGGHDTEEENNNIQNNRIDSEKIAPSEIDSDSSSSSSESDFTWLYSLVGVAVLILAVSIFIASRVKGRRMSFQKSQGKPENNVYQNMGKVESHEMNDLEGFSSKQDLQSNVINELTASSPSRSLNLDNAKAPKSQGLRSSASQPHIDWLSKTKDVNIQNDYRSYHSEAETQTDGENLSHNCKTVFRMPWQFSCTFTRDGGVLNRENSDVTLVVAKDAIKTGDYVKIKGAIFTDASEIWRKFDLSSDEVLITPLVEYHAEGAYQFQHHVSVKLPHALSEDFDISLIKFYTFTVDDCGNVQLHTLPLKSKDNSDVEDVDAYWEVSNQERMFIAKTTHFSGYFCTTCESKTKLPSIYARVYGSHVQIKSTRREVRLILYLWDRRLNIKDFIEAIMQQECDMDRQLLADEPVPLLENASSDSSIAMRMETLGDKDDQKCWSHVTRSNASRPLFKPLQVRKLRQIVLCCQQSDPMRIEWAMENVPGTLPSPVFQCLVEMVHVPEGVSDYEEAFQNADEEYIRTFYIRNLKLTKDPCAGEDMLSREEILKKAMSQIMDKKDMESICQAFGINKNDIGNLSRKFNTEDALKAELLEECSRKCGVEKFLQVLPHVLQETHLYHVIQALQARDLLSNLSSRKSKNEYVSSPNSCPEASCSKIPESTFCKSLVKCTVSEPRQQQCSNLDYNSLNAPQSNRTMPNPLLSLKIDSSSLNKREEQESPDSDYSSPSNLEGFDSTNHNQHELRINFSSVVDNNNVSQFSPKNQHSLTSEEPDCNHRESSFENTSCSMSNNFATSTDFNNSSDSNFYDSCLATIDSTDVKDREKSDISDDCGEETSRKELDVLGDNSSRDGCVTFPEIPEEHCVSNSGPNAMSKKRQPEKDKENCSHNTEKPSDQDETFVKETIV